MRSRVLLVCAQARLPAAQVACGESVLQRMRVVDELQQALDDTTSARPDAPCCHCGSAITVRDACRC